MSVLNFKCKRCERGFNCEVGEITFPVNSERPHFDRDIICKRCGILTMDEVELTEKGQTQLTEIHLKHMYGKDYKPGMSFMMFNE